jgi:hypothetical protein
LGLTVDNPWILVHVIDGFSESKPFDFITISHFAVIEMLLEFALELAVIFELSIPRGFSLVMWRAGDLSSTTVF